MRQEYVLDPACVVLGAEELEQAERALRARTRLRTVTRFALWPLRDPCTRRIFWLRRVVIGQRLEPVVDVRRHPIAVSAEWRTKVVTPA